MPSYRENDIRRNLTRKRRPVYRGNKAVDSKKEPTDNKKILELIANIQRQRNDIPLMQQHFYNGCSFY
jgi:hypothetical protein